MPAALYTQSETREFVHYGVREGLSNDIVTSITQDGMGYIWVGTDDGLNRFDGDRFETFYRNAPAGLLRSSKIRKVSALDEYRLLVATSSGFHVVQIDDFSIRTYLMPDSSAFGATRNRIWDAIELTDGQFAATTATGFYVYNADGSIAFYYDHLTPADIGNKRMLYGRTMFTIPDNQLLVYTGDDGLAIYSRNTQEFRNLERTEREWEEFQHPRATPFANWISENQIGEHEFVMIDHSDSLIYYHIGERKRVPSLAPLHIHEEFNWESKVFMLNDSSFIINSGRTGYYEFHIDRGTGHISCDGKKQMDSVEIQVVFADKNNRLWLGGRDGLWKQKLTSPHIRSYLRQLDGTSYGQKYGGHSPGQYTSALTYKSKVYMTRYSGEFGLVVFDSASLEIVDRIQFFDLRSAYNYSSSLQMYYRDTLWIGTDGGIIWLDTKTNNYGLVDLGLRSPPAFRILGTLGADGYAWMSTNMHGTIGRYHVADRTFKIFNF